MQHHELPDLDVFLAAFDQDDSFACTKIDPTTHGPRTGRESCVIRRLPADREGDGADCGRAESIGRRQGWEPDVRIPKDQDVLADMIEPAPGIICTSPVRTYLGLSVPEERGVESADHSRRKVLSWCG